MDSKIDSDVHILLADPDEGLRVDVRQALERQGYFVTVTSDGADVLARMQSGDFDVIIAAIPMPQRDGLEVLRQVQTTDSDAEVILLCEPNSIGSGALGLREGAFAYLLKPIEDLGQLTHSVENALELRRLRRQLASLPAEAVPPPAFAAELDSDAPFHRMAADACAGKPLSEIIQFLLQSSADIFDAPHAVLLRSRPEMSLQLDSAFGYDDTSSAAHDFLQTVGDAFAWRAATERKTLVESTSATEHLIGTPVMVRDQLLGVLVVYPVSVANTSPDRIAEFESLGRQGALVLETARLAAENDRLAPTDPLTGALKRTAFLDIGDREFRRSWRFDQPLTAIVLDVDDMQEMNRRYGRRFGDEVLRQVAQACRSVVRAFDLVARYDEDALAVLLIMTDRVGARGASERLRLAVNSVDLTSAMGPIHITASFGACTYPREGCASIFDLLDLAQAAQRTAHRSSANHVLFA